MLLNLPSAVTHVHPQFLFSFIQQMPLYACLSEHHVRQMGEAEKGGTVPTLGACELVAGLRSVHHRTS